MQLSSGLMDGVEKTVCFHNQATSVSMEELSQLFSKLCLCDKPRKRENDFQKHCNPFVIRLRNRRSKLTCSIFPTGWHFSNFKDSLVKTKNKSPLENGEQQFLKHLIVHSAPVFSCRFHNSAKRLVYRTVGLESECVNIARTGKADCSHHEDIRENDAAAVSIETFPCVASNAYISGPFSHFYRRRSSFSIFLFNLLTRAWRLGECAVHSSRRNLSTLSNKDDYSNNNCERNSFF